MPFVESAGRRIYYERHGHGPAVLFCHGAGSNAATWWQQLPAFAPQHTCVTMDIRCFGRSAAPLEEFSLKNFADDVIAILDCEQLERVVLVGQSLGGMIGLRLALTHPRRVAALIACDSTLAIDHPVLLATLEQRQITHQAVSIEQRSLGQRFLQSRPDLAQLYAQINHFNPSAHSIPAERWGRALAAIHAPGRLTPMSALGELRCPTLLLVGSEDPIVSPAVMHEVAVRVDGCEVVVVDGAGHSAYFERPDEFNRLALDFIARRCHGPS